MTPSTSFPFEKILPEKQWILFIFYGKISLFKRYSFSNKRVGKILSQLINPA
ncbi:hypothetical protein D920_00794 [Enterococcus faecalis 13-SD-W-01]|nr:hypothetical protein D920_00794 [Enterococcus faecalis 13-SD-W-01]